MFRYVLEDVADEIRCNYLRTSVDDLVSRLTNSLALLLGILPLAFLRTGFVPRRPTKQAIKAPKALLVVEIALQDFTSAGVS